jgi:NADH-quinone oxidoreductase subunit J
VLYTQYVYYFQASGLILLVAMIGAIGLTHRPSRTIKRQDVTAQITRKRTDAMVLTNPATGQGAGVSHWVGKGVEKKKSQ